MAVDAIEIRCVIKVKDVVVLNSDSHADAYITHATGDGHNVRVVAAVVGLEREVHAWPLCPHACGIGNWSDVCVADGGRSAASKVLLNVHIVGVEHLARISDLGSKPVVELTTEDAQNAVNVPAVRGTRVILVATLARLDLNYALRAESDAAEANRADKHCHVPCVPVQEHLEVEGREKVELAVHLADGVERSIGINLIPQLNKVVRRQLLLDVCVAIYSGGACSPCLLLRNSSKSSSGASKGTESATSGGHGRGRALAQSSRCNDTLHGDGSSAAHLSTRALRGDVLAAVVVGEDGVGDGRRLVGGSHGNESRIEVGEVIWVPISHVRLQCRDRTIICKIERLPCVGGVGKSKSRGG